MSHEVHYGIYDENIDKKSGTVLLGWLCKPRGKVACKANVKWLVKIEYHT